MADFYYSPLRPKTGETITFYPRDLSIQYKWNFGDGTLMIGSIVTHAYEAPGTFLVSARSPLGTSSSIIVTVYPLSAIAIMINIKYML